MIAGAFLRGWIRVRLLALTERTSTKTPQRDGTKVPGCSIPRRKEGGRVHWIERSDKEFIPNIAFRA